MIRKRLLLPSTELLEALKQRQSELNAHVQKALHILLSMWLHMERYQCHMNVTLYLRCSADRTGWAAQQQQCDSVFDHDSMDVIR